MKKSTTIHDIAKIAQVSSATVSRVLSNSNYPVSKELKERIQRVAKELNYIPNLIGKQLKKNTSMTIGVIIPSIANPFYSSVVFGIEEVARQNNFTVVTCNSLHDAVLEEEYIRTIMEKQIKGLIISSISTDKTLLRRLIDMGIQVIAIDQKIEEADISQIEFDYHRGGYLATRYLQDRGHRRIGYVTSKLDRPSRRSIFAGYKEAMESAQLEVLVAEATSEQQYNSIYEFDTGKQLTRTMMSGEQTPTAIFACNDMMAFGVIHELTTNDVQVPESVSVLGFDGIDFGQMIHPPLTSIKQPDYEMGKMAGNMLFDKMKGIDIPMFHVTLQPKLVERKSVTDL